MATETKASAVVAHAMAAQPQAGRGAYLRELLAYAAAGLAIIETPPEAAEALYRLADAVVEHYPIGGPTS